mmetsp:Transcript_39645/g.109214  ORF Transcript_39645/g.109214 Transcript_39645/m.109214 type:complete len:218 (-) Transcript_39645:219-872(-)
MGRRSSPDRNGYGTFHSTSKARFPSNAGFELHAPSDGVDAHAPPKQEPDPHENHRRLFLARGQWRSEAGVAKVRKLDLRARKCDPWVDDAHRVVRGSAHRGPSIQPPKYFSVSRQTASHDVARTQTRTVLLAACALAACALNKHAALRRVGASALQLSERSSEGNRAQTDRDLARVVCARRQPHREAFARRQRACRSRGQRLFAKMARGAPVDFHVG